MHPLAATLALHGCGIFRYDVDRACGYAVARIPLRSRQVELWFNDGETGARITGVSPYLDDYSIVTWDVIPHERWDGIEQRTMDAFLERL
ncbi:hypothetical protein [Burkholderia cenocepacia]|uniref:hypothetical protein n=1 Tax=Burkholderia cenocepacia TaxID=95486 RepID=UPI0026544FB6|nr:hypothetical protein [Burkholderia cenocepacia]MDN7537053.1 hypothetical protein [Burkholderia cenocepacia]